MSNSNLRSMTGYGRGEAEGPMGRFTVELKSVNSRFQEIRVNLPPVLMNQEMAVRTFLKSRIGRGKIDCRIKFEPAADQVPQAEFNEPLMMAYAERLRAIASQAGLQADVSLGDLVRLPGAIEVNQQELETDQSWPTLEEGLGRALAAFQAERAREGAALGAQILAEVELLKSLREKILAAKEGVAERYREKLTARIAELEEQIRAKLDPGRLELEVAMFADRADVSEEVTRLEAHLARMEELVGASEQKPVGKDLDFLIQEILREVNTTASKMREVEAVQVALEMKGAVERIREQIQNIE